MAENREVKATLDLGLDPAAGKAMRELTTLMGNVAKSYEKIQLSAERAAKAAASNRVIGPLTGSAGDAAERARKAGGRAFMTPEEKKSDDQLRRRNDRFTGGLFAAAGAARTGVEVAAAATQGLNDPYQTSTGMWRGVAKAIPGGAWGLRVGEMLNNREGKFTEARVTGEQQGLDVQERVKKYGTTQGYDIPQAGREEAAAQARNASPIYGSRVNRTTASGEQFFREEQRLLPIRRELAKNEREMAAATKEYNAAAEHESKLKTKLKDLDKQRTAAVKEAAKWEDPEYRKDLSKEDREKAILATRLGVSNVEKEIQGTAEAATAAGQARGAAKGRMGEATGRGFALQAQQAENKASIFEDRAATASGSARSLGGMNVFDRAFGLQAFKALQQYGPDALPPEMLAAAQQFAPQTAGKLLEQHGAGTAEFKEGQSVAPADFTGNPEELRRKADDARREAEGFNRQSERAFTESAAEAGRGMGELVNDAMLKMFESFRREVENGKRIERAGAN